MKNDKEVIKALNQIVAIIDSKAAAYKDERSHMSQAQAFADKKLINDLIKDAELLAASLNQKPVELISDLNRLRKTL